MAKVDKFGTFGGVFTPSILTILGVIMYLRLPMIVGQAGLWLTLGIILIAHLISVTTGLSISSLATDKKVEAGGTYYMISRSLGLPIGGTLGLALFTGLSLSVSLYLIGFSESLLSYFGYEMSINSIRITGTIALVAVTIITIISTSLAIKTQFLIMAAIVFSLFSIFMGQHDFGPPVVSSIDGSSSTIIPFMVLFGIFFPAVTGFEAGVSMSGDLKDPRRSIPLGSLMAIIVGLIIYAGLTFFLWLTVDRQILSDDPQVLLKISWVPQLVIAGIWGATLSSALGSILGAPRILQAIAIDKIMPRIFAKGRGAANEPRNALILTFLIAETGILIGELNMIARVVSIFFITTYGAINLSCAFERWTSADFRPTFKTPGWISLLGAVACFIVMIELDFVATVGAGVILGGLYFYLKRKELSLQSGDAWSGIWSSLLKTSIFRLTGAKEHTRNWRPNILMFNGADQARPFMLSLGTAISGKLGLLSSFELIPSENSKLTRLERHKGIEDSRDKTFHHTYLCKDIYSGIDEIIRAYGFPGVEPNTVLMGWTSKKENKEKFITLMKRIQQYNFNSLFLYHNNVNKTITQPAIDIWWSGRGNNLSLALNILRHLTSSDPWSRSSVRICTILSNPDDKDKVERFMRNILTDYRTTAKLNVINNHLTVQNELDIISRESAGADLTVIGMQDSRNGDIERTFQKVEDIARLLGTAMFIHASDAFQEHNIVAYTSPVALTGNNDWVLPDLEKSKYPELEVDIEKIDIHGKELMRALYNKVFKPTFQLESDVFRKIISLTSNTAATLQKATRHNERYQRIQAIEKTQKYFMEQLNESVDKILTRSIEEQAVPIQEGMKWYLQQIESDINRFPKAKYVRHEKREFDLQKSDSSALRWFKIVQRLLHPFSKQISRRINFREGASYFFRDTRYHFLTIVMADVERILTASRERLRHYISWMDESVTNITKASVNESAVNDLARQVQARAENLRDQHEESANRCRGRLLVEYRKNVNFYLRQIEHLDFNRAMRKKRRTKNFYQKKKRELVNFSSVWMEQAILDFNTLKTNVIVLRYYNAVYDEIQNFNLKVAQFFENQQKKIDKLKQTLLTFPVAPGGKSKQPELPELNTNYNYLNEALQEMSEKLLSQEADIIYEITVSVQDKEKETLVTLPLRSMLVHLAESILSAPLEVKLDTVLKAVKRKSFTIEDRAKLALFNVSNLRNEEAQSRSEEEMKSAILSIEEESESLKQIAESISQEIAEQSNRLKNALSLHELVAMAGDFSQRIRLRKTRQLGSKVSEKLHRITMLFNKAFISILYSRAKGILLARQLSSDVEALSVNERIVNQVTRLAPKTDILQKLPYYYVSLFNRRSSIGDNFWVTRPIEENALEEIYKRYQTNGRGMILVMSEPNAGKSALCKYFAQKKSHRYTAYHVFAPEDGSTDIFVFEEALRKATGLQGDSTLLFSMLPQDSMIILHDLELWWERSEPHGLRVVQHIKWMVESFSNKCLFVVNTTPFSYLIINAAEPLDIHCAGIVRCVPFNSYELKQLIMTRHNSSGLMLDFISEGENFANEIKIARVFNKLFAYSNGNPGVALNAWLTGIQHYSDKTITWRRPSDEDGSALKQMPEVWGHYCFQLLVHNRMSIHKMERCLQMEQTQIIEITGIMHRLGLITEYAPAIYNLNPHMELLFINHFKEKEWI